MGLESTRNPREERGIEKESCVFVLLCVFDGSRVWTQGLVLARRALLYHLATSLDFFALLVFHFSEMVSHFFPGVSLRQ